MAEKEMHKAVCASSEKTITYFGQSGEENTNKVLELAKNRANELQIKDFVIASTTGKTGVKASNLFRGSNVVVVTHSAGFKLPNSQEFENENRSKIEKNGGKILTGTHVFMNVERAIIDKFNTAYPSELIAQTLRLLGQGTKVAVEAAAMAADAGLIRTDREVISIGGTGKGADTALVIQPANSTRIFDIVIKEVIAKPRER